MISLAVLFGIPCHRQATSPQTTGVENEVPMSLVTTPRPLTRRAGAPMATTSGFTRPSCEGPTLLNGAMRGGVISEMAPMGSSRIGREADQGFRSSKLRES